MRWIEQGLGPVPIEFGRLVEAAVTSPELRSAIDGPLEAKRAGAELDYGPRVPAISRFIDTEMARLEGAAGDQPSPEVPVAPLDELFRATLAEAWPGRRL